VGRTLTSASGVSRGGSDVSRGPGESPAGARLGGERSPVQKGAEQRQEARGEPLCAGGSPGPGQRPSSLSAALRKGSGEGKGDA